MDTMQTPSWIDTKFSVWHGIQLAIILIGVGIAWGDLKANQAVLKGQVDATMIAVAQVRSEYLRQDVSQAQNETTTAFLKDLRERMQRIEDKLDQHSRNK